MVNSRLNNTQIHGMSWWACVETKRTDPIATSAKLFDITQESYGFSADVIETIN